MDFSTYLANDVEKKLEIEKGDFEKRSTTTPFREKNTKMTQKMIFRIFLRHSAGSRIC